MLVDELGDERDGFDLVAEDEHRRRLARPPLAAAGRVVGSEGRGAELIEPFE